jgi:coenzyme Q-binding protein COQ10
MAQFKAKRLVAVPADIAFAVAADVASYKDFLPLLQRSTIRGRKTETATGETFDAELAVSYPKLGLAEAFVSRVETNHAAKSVTATSNDGPFRAISTQWQISPAASGCEVGIAIDYAFRNPLIQIAAGGLMDMAITKVMAAFETRALSIQRAASSSS